MKKQLSFGKRIMILMLVLAVVFTGIQPAFATQQKSMSLSENAVAEGVTTVSDNAASEKKEITVSDNTVQPEVESSEEDSQSEEEEEEEIDPKTVYALTDIPERITKYVGPGSYSGGSITVVGINATDNDYKVEATSSNTKVADVHLDELVSEDCMMIYAHSLTYIHVYYDVYKVGSAMITLTVGEKEYEIPIYGYKTDWPKTESIKQIDYNSVKITWKPQKQFSGYFIKQLDYDTHKNEKIVAQVEGAMTDNLTFDIKEWDVTYDYAVVGYMKSGTDYFEPIKSMYSGYLPLNHKKLGTEIKSVKQLNAKKVLITWKKVSGAKKYYLYRATHKDGKYKKIYSGKANVTQYTDKVSSGVTYYYKIKVKYSKFTSDDSAIVSKILPKSLKAKRKWLSISNLHFIGDQYEWYWANPDKIVYYVASGKLYAVCAGYNCINVYTLDSSFEVIKTKKIKLKFDTWGGFYAAPDGNFYVVVGYYNEKESTKKTVIKVIKYNKKWKEVKTAKIKGGVSNKFEGITYPFDAGNCALDMKGNTLYIHTSREMFKGTDGLRHQSNISFAVNTKTMKAVTTEDVYSSHSFNQYAKFDGYDLYLLDHGDAYPRAICLSKIADYGKKAEAITEHYIFELKGDAGDNFTGCTVGGMEVGKNNVLVCGSAHPHYSKVKGVKGSKAAYAYNVYVLITDKKTGKTKVKWLTQNNPKTSKVQIEGTRMVKLDDNRYAIMYTATKNDVSTLHYVVINEKGKKIYSKTYKNYEFKTGAQPIVYKGRVVWMSYEFDASSGQYRNRINAIPALIK